MHEQPPSKEYLAAEEKINTVVESLRDQEMVVGLPYYVVFRAGEQFRPKRSGEDALTQPTYAEIVTGAQQTLTQFGFDAKKFEDLSQDYEHQFRVETSKMEPPAHISQNPQWLAEWNGQTKGIILSSYARTFEQDDLVAQQ